MAEEKSRKIEFTLSEDDVRSFEETLHVDTGTFAQNFIHLTCEKLREAKVAWKAGLKVDEETVTAMGEEVTIKAIEASRKPHE